MVAAIESTTGVSLLPNKISFHSTHENVSNAVSQIKETLTYYEYNPPSLNHSRFLVAMNLLKLFNDSAAEFGIDESCSYVITVTELMFPGSAAQLALEPGINLVPIKVRTDLDSFYPEDVFRNTMTSDDVRPLKNIDFVAQEEYDLGLGIVTPDESIKEISDLAAAARWGIEMFVIGKNVDASNLPAFTVNRPLAVKNKYQMQGTIDEDLFKPPYLPTLDGLKKIKLAFDAVFKLRKSMATMWIGWSKELSTRTIDAFCTTFILTDGYGLTAPAIIQDLIIDCPKVLQHPLLRSDCISFIEAVRHYIKIDATERGFLKVIYGDKHRLFSQSSRTLLAAVAKAHAIRKSPTMVRYGNFGEFETIVKSLMSDLGLATGDDSSMPLISNVNV